MKAQKSFWQRYWTYIVICTVFICLMGFLRVYNSHLKRQEFRDKFTIFKKPPPNAAEGGHWHTDGTWHNAPDPPSKKRLDPHPKTEKPTNEPHPHDLLTDEEHEEIHRKEREELDRKYEEGKKELARLRAKMKEDERAAEEQREFEKLIPNFQKQILKYEDYDFIFTYPTPVQIVEQFPNRESLKAFCERLTKFQSLIIEVSDEINKRPAFAKRMQREYPDFMTKLNKVRELEIPQL